MSEFQRTRSKDTGAGALERLYADELRRLQRVLGFGQELARSLRKEFAQLWRAPPPPGQAGDEARALKAALDELFALLAEGDYVVRECAGWPLARAHKALEAFGVERAIGLARSVADRAAALRATRASRLTALGARLTGPLAAPAPGRRSFGAATVIELAASETAKLARQWWGDGGKAERAILAVERRLALGAEALVRVSPMLEVLASTLAYLGPPGSPRLEVAARAAYRQDLQAGKVPVLQQHWLPVLVPALARDAHARQLAHVAVGHWEQARLVYGEGQVALATSRAADPERVEALLAQIDPTRLQRVLVPLANLALTFKDVWPLNEILGELPHIEQLGPAPGRASGQLR